MIRFLLQRPIAVLMAFTAFFIMGLATYFTLPVSLLPDIAIPEITVQVTGANRSARELENTVVKTIRQQLMQVAGLRDIHSETRDGAAIVRLSFDYGTDTDLAFIEVNEKIDAAMNYLPRELDRPRVVKASATDIPVFCLNLTLKRGESEAAFLDLCQLAEQVIKRRIEQLPEVAMVDVTGLVGRQVRILPDDWRVHWWPTTWIRVVWWYEMAITNITSASPPCCARRRMWRRSTCDRAIDSCSSRTWRRWRWCLNGRRGSP